jgi:hypothetical protein
MPRGGGFRPLSMSALAGGLFGFSRCFGVRQADVIAVVEVFGDEASDADLAEVVEEGADLLGCLVHLVGEDWVDAKVLIRRHKRTFTIFEGTSEIQHLVIARAISGVHIQ